MALPPKRIIEPVTSPQHYVPPTGRELRSQSVQRLQVGMFGLCAMLLLVALANIIMDRAKLSDEGDPLEEVIAADAGEKKPATDPLADIGVVPAASPSPIASDAPRDPVADPAGMPLEPR